MRLYDVLDLDMYELQLASNMSRKEVLEVFKTLLFYEGLTVASCAGRRAMVKYNLVKRKFMTYQRLERNKCGQAHV